jgi:hypothetical protein
MNPIAFALVPIRNFSAHDRFAGGPIPDYLSAISKNQVQG